LLLEQAWRCRVEDRIEIKNERGFREGITLTSSLTELKQNTKIIQDSGQ